MSRSNLVVEYTRILNAVTTGDGTIGPARASRIKEWCVYAEWSAGVTAGAVTVESAPYEGYTGTWQSIGVLSWTAASRIDQLNFTGLHGAVRVRVSTTVVGGTVTCYIGGRD